MFNIKIHGIINKRANEETNMKTSDYIIYNQIHNSTTGSGSSSSGSGCFTFICILVVIVLALAGLSTITFSEVAAVLILIFVPLIGIYVYSKFKKIIYRRTCDTEKSGVSNGEGITISIVSLILFLAILLGFANIKGGIISMSVHMSAPKILEEYNIEDYEIDVTTYNGGLNNHSTVIYIIVPQKTASSLSTYSKLDLLEDLYEIALIDIRSEICIVVGEKVEYISYQYGRHLETESYEIYNRVRKNVYSYDFT